MDTIPYMIPDTPTCDDVVEDHTIERPGSAASVDGRFVAVSVGSMFLSQWQALAGTDSFTSVVCSFVLQIALELERSKCV